MKMDIKFKKIYLSNMKSSNKLMYFEPINTF